MLYRIAICDDIKEFALVLEEKIKFFFDRKGIPVLIDYYESGFTMLRALENHRYEIVFLDMEMPDLNGIETGEAIRKFNKEVKIIYVTAHPGYALDSYKVHAFDYLLKPVEQNKMNQSLEELLHNLEKDKEEVKTVSFLEHRIMKTIGMKQILFLEKEKSHVRIHCENESYLTTENLSEVLAKLDNELFIQTHQGYAVSLDRIHSIQRDQAILQDGRAIPIGRKYREQVKNRFFENLRR